MASIQSLQSQSPLNRATTSVLPPDGTTPSFIISAKDKSYKHQYSNIYFLRLRHVREYVEDKARKRWNQVAGNPEFVPRVLEVVKSQLCFIIGTVYMDMPLKPNVMEDIARDHSIPPPPPPPKYLSEDDKIMLEDESGRIRLVGASLQSAGLVTGVIIGALGMETPNGEFEVADICYAGMPPQRSSQKREKDSMDVDEQSKASSSRELPSDEWIAIVSGLDMGAPSPSDGPIQMLVEYLTGEGGGTEDQVSASQISRLIIAGNSLAPMIVTGKGEADVEGESKKSRKFGYDGTTFSNHPIINFSAHLLDIGRVMPIHLLPGETDPSGVILPQQPLPRPMFGAISSFPSFSCETNPTYLRISSESSPLPRTFLIHSGQPVNDMFKYLSSPPYTRLGILESTLKWRHMAPTAPDTLWCHPYFLTDPFLLSETPDIYIAGGQSKFMTKMVVDDGEDDEIPKQCRLVLVPQFAKTGVLVLLNMRTLGVKTVKFAVEGMMGGSESGGEAEQESTTSASTPLVEPESSVPHSSNSSRVA